MMKLPLPFLEKKEAKSYFLVLILRHNKASAVIFEEIAGKVKVLNQAWENFDDSIETASEEELLNVLDKTISKAESVLPQNIETQKTIFGLKENWAEENKIKKEYLGKLKKISDELGLVPIGFLVTSEAIGHFLAKEEGAPVSAILAEIDRDWVCVSLIRAGKIVESKTSKLEGKAPEAVDSLLKHFENVEVLPSRIIIFDGEKDLTQDFISHSWSKTLPFLHLPQITNLEKGFDAKAVLSGAASEMGFEVSGESGKAKRRTESVQELSQEDEGEIVTEGKTSEEAQEETSEIPEDVSAEFFGFVKNKDIANEKIKQTKETEKIPSEVVGEEITEIPQELQIEEAESKSLPANAGVILAGARKILTLVLENIKKLPFKFPISSTAALPKGRKIILIPAAILVFLILLFIFYLFTKHATVTLSINGKKVSQEKDITFSTSSKTSTSQNIIAAQFADVSENGSVSTNATGKKDIGTPAKGTVTVFNNSSNQITLQNSTQITSSNNLNFTLDKSITVASASGDVFSGTTPGKTDVSVTAADIGTNYNLPSQTHFSFSGNNSIAAKNDNPFSGGTKKTITVVSKDDTAKLENDLAKNLEQKAKDDIGKKISQDMVLLPVFINETLNNKNFDKNAGDEASNITLKADVDYKSITYNKSDLNFFAGDIFKTSDNLVLDGKSIKTSEKNIKTSGSSVLATVEISGFMLPKIDQPTLAKEVSGKSLNQAHDILVSISQVSNVTIKISPNIPLFPKTLPGPPKIQFEINSNE